MPPSWRSTRPKGYPFERIEHRHRRGFRPEHATAPKPPKSGDAALYRVKVCGIPRIKLAVFHAIHDQPRRGVTRAAKAGSILNDRPPLRIASLAGQKAL